MKTETFMLPTHWAPALVNGDYTGYGDSDLDALEGFQDWMVAEYGACHCLGPIHDARDNITPEYLTRWHDARRWVPLMCECYEYQFDVTQREAAQ